MNELDLVTRSCMVKGLQHHFARVSKNKESDNVDTPILLVLLAGRRTLPSESLCSTRLVLYDPKEKQTIHRWFNVVRNRCQCKDESTRRRISAFSKMHAIHRPCVQTPFESVLRQDMVYGSGCQHLRTRACSSPSSYVSMGVSSPDGTKGPSVLFSFKFSGLEGRLPSRTRPIVSLSSAGDETGHPRRGKGDLWTVQDARRSKDRRQRPTSSAMRRKEGASTDESGPSASVSTVHVRHNSRRFPGARQAGALKQRLAANVEKMASQASQAIAPGTSKTRASSEAICWEIYGGRKRAYVFNPLGKKKAVGRAVGGNVELQVIEARDDGRGPLRRVKNLAKSYMLPEGWPGSVAKGYAPYMGWRAIQHFFGGAMGVFTTRSLLASLGVGRPGTSAAAINWVLKDGAGRFGKMLFARQGRKLDGELKQYRLAGNVLMEVGAGMELATVWCPQFFLPLACLANLTKQVAAVTASATRAPIYKSLALEYNLGDITAKGESVGNLTDLMGTAVGIYLAKKNPATWVAFAGLSSGFLLASYLEVKSVRLPYLNRARLQIAARTFLESGKVPGVDEANKREKLWPVTPPWVVEKQPIIGATVAEAFENPDDLRRTLKLFDKSKYVMAYCPEKRQPYVLLKEGACQKDLLKGCFHAFLLQHILEERVAALDKERGPVDGIRKWQRERVVHSSETVHQALKDSCHQISSRFSDFREEAVQHGWNMDDAMINAGEARIIPRHGSIWVQSKLAKINEILHQQ